MSAAGSSTGAPAATTPAAPATPAAAPATPPAAPAVPAASKDAAIAAKAKEAAAARADRERVAALEAENAKLKADLEANGAKAKEWDTFTAQLASKDKALVKRLRDGGMTFDEVATLFLTEGEENDLPPEVRALGEDMKAIKARIADEDKAKADAKTAEEQKQAAAAAESVRKDVGAMLDGWAGELPFCSEYRDEVIDLAIGDVRAHLAKHPITETDPAKQDEAAKDLVKRALHAREAQLAAESKKEHERLSRLVAPRKDLAYSRDSKLTVIERQQPPAQTPGTRTIGSGVRGALPANQPRVPMSGKPRQLGEPLSRRSE